MVTDEQRLEKFRQQPESFRAMYGSLETAQLLKATREKYHIDVASEFVSLVGDTMLGFHTKAQLQDLLRQQLSLSSDAAARVVSELENLFDISRDTVSTAPVVSQQASEMPTHFIPPHDLTHQRTMPADIETLRREGNGQRSSVPRYAKPLTDTPRYDEGSTG